MNYLHINYYKLRNLPQFKFYIIGIIITIIFLVILILSFFLKVNKKVECFGIYENKILKIQINSELSDIIKNNNVLYFNNMKTSYEIIRFGNYEFINNNVYEMIEIAVDEWIYNNEVGKVTIYYEKQRLIFYIFELFK